MDVAANRVRGSFNLPGSPSGMAVSGDGARLFVTCAAPESIVCTLDIKTGAELGRITTGHTACAPVLSPDGKTLYVCCRFNDSVSVLSLEQRKELHRINVLREPVAADLTRDGKYLLVANMLPVGRADQDDVAAAISVVDVCSAKAVKTLRLPIGSSSVQAISVSPDGRYAVATHIVARFHLPTTQLERGWMNTNAKTIIDLKKLEVLETVLVDNVESGAANPWGLAWADDGRKLLVAHAGTHEISVIDFPGVLDRVAHPKPLEPAGTGVYASLRAEPVNDLSFLVGLRQRIKLPAGDYGPRAVAVVGSKAYAANYFSDSLTVIDLAHPRPQAESLALAKSEWDVQRKGEFYFHDASICFQGWQSCSSCHPGEARVDGLNWDLLNDGIGNPKNNKSLLLAHQTPPSMSLGIRETAETAVRSGIRHILFTVQPDAVASAIDAYLKSLKPVPSPYLVQGKLSESAQRGAKIFETAGCVSCHPGPLFTDLRSYDVGTRGRYDKAQDEFDTPTLIEVWRTAPYLHDGSAATLRELLTTRNPNNDHGKISGLSEKQLDDLCAYVLSL
jgi:DNA-binding beta-propeller fold protein YncE